MALTGLKIFINSIERSIADNTYNYTKDGSNRPSLNLKIGGFQTGTLKQFDKVEIKVNDILVFDGFVESIQSVDFQTGFERIIFTATILPFEQFFNFKYVGRVFRETTLSLVVDDFFTRFLQPEGITLGLDQPEISDDLIVDFHDFNKEVTVTSGLDELADWGNYTWYIDHNKEFFFFQPSVDGVNVLNIDDTTRLQDIKINSDIGEYRNKQIIIGGSESTSLEAIQSFTGDNITREWNVTYPLNEILSIKIYTNRSIGATPNPDDNSDFVIIFPPDQIGIYGVDNENDSVLWLFNIRKPTFRIKDSLTNGVSLRNIDLDETIEIIYSGFQNIDLQQTDPTGVANIQNKLGGTGEVEFVENHLEVDNFNIVANIAQIELQVNKDFKDLVEFSLFSTLEPDIFDWEVGDLITSLNNPIVPDDDYIIQSISYQIYRNIKLINGDFETIFIVTVIMSSNENIDTWKEFWKKEKSKNIGNGFVDDTPVIKDVTINEFIFTNEQLNINDNLLQFNETINTNEVLNIDQNLLQNAENTRITEQLFSNKIFAVYPANNIGDLAGISGSIIYDNYAGDDNLFIFS